MRKKWNLHIVVGRLTPPQIIGDWETRNTVLGVRAKKSPNFKLFTLCGLQKIRKKDSKKLLHSTGSMYIIKRLVKREEAGSYRASG